jgi:hypothetical protein
MAHYPPKGDDTGDGAGESIPTLSIRRHSAWERQTGAENNRLLESAPPSGVVFAACTADARHSKRNQSSIHSPDEAHGKAIGGDAIPRHLVKPVHFNRGNETAVWKNQADFLVGIVVIVGPKGKKR